MGNGGVFVIDVGCHVLALDPDLLLILLIGPLLQSTRARSALRTKPVREWARTVHVICLFTIIDCYEIDYELTNSNY